MLDDHEWFKTCGWFAAGIAAMAALIGVMALMVALSGCATTHQRPPCIQTHTCQVGR